MDHYLPMMAKHIKGFALLSSCFTDTVQLCLYIFSSMLCRPAVSYCGSSDSWVPVYIQLY